MVNQLNVQFSERLKKGEKLFIPYIMAGDGGIEILKERLLFLESKGAAAIEIGIPFSDPVADGPVIQEAGIRALQTRTTLIGVLNKIREIRSDIKVPLIIMTYTNPILALGIERFTTELQEAGIEGCIIPDLPIEEEEIIVPHLDEIGVELVRLVTMATPIERIRHIAKRGGGFLYAVTVKGITGLRSDYDSHLVTFLDMVKQVSPIPVIAGFGVSTSLQVQQLSQYCDGVVVGSKIVELFHKEKLEEISELIQAIK